MFSASELAREGGDIQAPLRQTRRLSDASKASCLSYFLNALQKAVGYGPANYARLGGQMYSCCKSHRTVHLTDRVIIAYIDASKHGRRLLEARGSRSSSRDSSTYFLYSLMSLEDHNSREDRRHQRTSSMTIASQSINSLARVESSGHGQRSSSSLQFARRSDSRVSEEPNDQLEVYYSDTYLAQKIEKIIGNRHRGHYRVFDVTPSTNHHTTHYETLKHIELTTLSVDQVLSLCHLVNAYLKSDHENVAVINIGTQCTAAVMACLLMYLYPNTMSSLEAKRKYRSMIKLGLFVRQGSNLRLEVLPSELQFIDKYANYLKRRNSPNMGHAKFIHLNEVTLQDFPRFDRTGISLMCMVNQENSIVHNSLLRDRGLKRVNPSDRHVKFNLGCTIGKDAWIRVYHCPETRAPRLLCEIHIHPYLLDPSKRFLSVAKQELDRVSEDPRFSNDFHVILNYDNGQSRIPGSDGQGNLSISPLPPLEEIVDQSTSVLDPIDQELSTGFSDSHHSDTIPSEELTNGGITDHDSSEYTTSTTFPGMLQEEYYQRSHIDVMVRGPQGALPSQISQLPTCLYSEHSPMLVEECQICKTHFNVSVVDQVEFRVVP
jgi:hypothetical protein